MSFKELSESTTWKKCTEKKISCYILVILLNFLAKENLQEFRDCEKIMDLCGSEVR